MVQTCAYLYSSNFTPQVKEARINHKFLIGNRFHVTLRIVSPIILFKKNYHLIQIYLNKMIGLTMRSVTWNRFPIKNLWLIPCFLHLWSEVTWKYFVIGNFRGTCSSVEILKGNRLICWHAVGVHAHLSECWRGTWWEKRWEPVS